MELYSPADAAILKCCTARSGFRDCPSMIPRWNLAASHPTIAALPRGGIWPYSNLHPDHKGYPTRNATHWNQAPLPFSIVPLPLPDPAAHLVIQCNKSSTFHTMQRHHSSQSDFISSSILSSSV